MKTLTQHEYDSLVALARFGKNVLINAEHARHDLPIDMVRFIAERYSLLDENTKSMTELAERLEGL